MKHTALLFFLTVSLVLGTSAFAAPGDGRGIADAGNTQDLQGTLVLEEGFLYLETADRARYQLLLGPFFYREQIGFDVEKSAGQNAAVKGFVDEKAILPVLIQVNGQDYAFRTEDGLPLWRGQGRGRGWQQGDKQALNRTGRSRGRGRGYAGNCDPNCPRY